MISKKSLNTLNKLSNDTGLSREQLIKSAVSIHRINLKNKHKNHEKALKEISKLAATINETEDALKKFLHPEDSVLIRFGYIAGFTNNLCFAIESEINN